MTDTVLEYEPESAGALVKEVARRSGQNLSACYQCRRCAAGCPVAEETGYVTPDRLVRLILLGDREKALVNELVWRCVSCYTCGTRCPNEIQTARITETLKKMSKEARRPPLRHKVAHFHHSFMKAGLRWGRINEIEFMGAYELKNALKDLARLRFKAVYDEMVYQAKFGLAMMKLRRMHYGFLSTKGRDEIKRLAKKGRNRA
ncbi:MAG: 4Fe-4S dicluster domain-containing protein [Desulfobacterales bacterium]|nr:4Fe-4S dicluster domain-containing protein [Desulfobacterales bacterium]